MKRKAGTVVHEALPPSYMMRTRVSDYGPGTDRKSDLQNTTLLHFWSRYVFQTAEKRVSPRFSLELGVCSRPNGIHQVCGRGFGRNTVW